MHPRRTQTSKAPQTLPSSPTPPEEESLKLITMIPTLFALLLIAGSSSFASAETCLEKHGPAEGSHGYIYSTMVVAVRSDDFACVKELLEGGANPDESNYYSTPLLVASEEGYTDIAEVLLKYGAIPNDRTFRNESPIYLAVCAGKPGIVKLLVDAGISTDITDFDGNTPSEAACSCRDAPADCPKAEMQALMAKPSIKVYYNHDFASSDGVINDGSKDITANNRECNALCAKTSGCKVWTRIKRNVSGGNKEGECWLRNYQPSASECDSCDSGVMECEVYDHTDYTTTDDLVSTFVTGKTKSDQDCCGLCYNNSECKSWTWIKWDTEHNKKGECWLRKGYSQGHDKQSTASGQIKKN